MRNIQNDYKTNYEFDNWTFKITWIVSDEQIKNEVIESDSLIHTNQIYFKDWRYAVLEEDKEIAPSFTELNTKRFLDLIEKIEARKITDRRSIARDHKFIPKDTKEITWRECLELVSDHIKDKNYIEIK